MRKTGKSSETAAGGAGAEGGMRGGGNVTGAARPQPQGPFSPVRCLASLPCTCYVAIPKCGVSKEEVGQTDGTKELVEHPVVVPPHGMQESCPRCLRLPSPTHWACVSCSPIFCPWEHEAPGKDPCLYGLDKSEGNCLRALLTNTAKRP